MKLVSVTDNYNDYLTVRSWLKELIGEEPMRFLKDKHEGTYSLYTTPAGEEKVLELFNLSSQDKLAV